MYPQAQQTAGNAALVALAVLVGMMPVTPIAVGTSRLTSIAQKPLRGFYFYCR